MQVPCQLSKIVILIVIIILIFRWFRGQMPILSEATPKSARDRTNVGQIGLR